MVSCLAYVELLTQIYSLNCYIVPVIIVNSPVNDMTAWQEDSHVTTM